MPVGNLIRAAADHPHGATRTFLRFEDTAVSFGAYYAECVRWANLFRTLKRSGEPFHVGVLLDNVPEYFYALGGAALAGAVVAGINNTKRGQHLVRDIVHTDCQILITEDRYIELLEPVQGDLGIAPECLLVSHRWSGSRPLPPGTLEPSSPFYRNLDTALEEVGSGHDPEVSVADTDTYVLVFTSGTVTAPKAVICSHGRMVETGKHIGANVYAITPDDVGYVAMPMFHANALMCAFMPALCYGAGLALIRKFSTTRWLSDVRRYGVTFFNYTGKPLAYILSTPRLPDDRDNPLRICYGNEGSQRVTAEFEARFGCTVIDVFGASEGGLGVVRQPGDPAGSIGFPAPGIVVVDEHGQERPPARFDDNGCLLNSDDAVGEIVNTAGQAWFEGYYKNAEALRDRTRNGWYWSGDLGYKDARGYLYFAGRDVEWLRVDGENFLARPIEEILGRHPDILLAAVYGVPDPDGGDRVMAAVLLRAGAAFDGDAFAHFLRAQPDLSPKWVPAYVRIARDLPLTATAKVLKNDLRRQKFRPDRCTDMVYWRPRAGEAFRRFTAADYAALRQRFGAVGKLALLDL